MALRAASARFLARTALAPKVAQPVRGGGGGPVALGSPPTQPLPEEDELLWDDGSAQPEMCLDQYNQVGKYEALGYLSGGLLFFAGLIALSVYKVSREPPRLGPRNLPFDNLKAELGRE